MENNLPKRQLTFISGKLNITFRCDDKEEFKVLMEEAVGYLKAYEASNAPVTPNNDVLAAHNASQTSYPPCPKCHGEQVFNPKTSKVFCKAKCWLNY